MPSKSKFAVKIHKSLQVTRQCQLHVLTSAHSTVRHIAEKGLQEEDPVIQGGQFQQQPNKQSEDRGVTADELKVLPRYGQIARTAMIESATIFVKSLKVKVLPSFTNYMY